MASRCDILPPLTQSTEYSGGVSSNHFLVFPVSRVVPRLASPDNDTSTNSLTASPAASCKTSLLYYHRSSNIAVGCVSTLMTNMNTFRQFLLSSMSSALRAGLTSPVGVHLGKIHPTFPANPRKDFKKTTPSCVETMLCQHSTTGCFKVQIRERKSFPHHYKACERY